MKQIGGTALTGRDCPIFGLFGAARRPSPQVRGHIPLTVDGSSTVLWTLSTGPRTRVRHFTDSDQISGSAGTRVLGRRGRLPSRQAVPGQRVCLAAGCAGREDGQDRHLMEQPMLGRCGSGTGRPARVSSMAARSSSPVTGLPFPGVDWSNAPR